MTQKVLMMWTERNSLRATAVGWNCEDSSLYNSEKPIGFTRSPERYTYPYPLAAMADGWKLLTPPSIDGKEGYLWWFVKD